MTPPAVKEALEAAPVIRLGETIESFKERYLVWYRESRGRALESLQAAQGGKVVAEDACEYCDNMGLDCSNTTRLTRPLVRADAHPLPDGAVREFLIQAEAYTEKMRGSAWAALDATATVDLEILLEIIRAALLSSKPEGAQVWSVENIGSAPEGWYWVGGCADNGEFGYATESMWDLKGVKEFLETGTDYNGENVTRAFGPIPQPPAAGGEG